MLQSVGQTEKIVEDSKQTTTDVDWCNQGLPLISLLVFADNWRDGESSIVSSYEINRRVWTSCVPEIV